MRSSRCEKLGIRSDVASTTRSAAMQDASIDRCGNQENRGGPRHKKEQDEGLVIVVAGRETIPTSTCKIGHVIVMLHRAILAKNAKRRQEK